LKKKVVTTKPVNTHYRNLKIIGRVSRNLSSRQARKKTKAYLCDEKYSCKFWAFVSKDPLLSDLEGLDNLISEEDASCLRSLYSRMKDIFTEDVENSSEPNDRIDYSNKPNWWCKVKYDSVFNSKVHQLLDRTYEELLTDNPITNEIFKKSNSAYFSDNPLLWKNVFEEQEKSEAPVFRFRPYNMESKSSS
jgi:hypothetical protein